MKLKPEPPSAHIPVRMLSAAAGLLFAAGVAASLLHAPAQLAVALRCAAFALFVPYALRRRSLLVWTFAPIMGKIK